jgi:uracil phosphoribosyltransferase
MKKHPDFKTLLLVDHPLVQHKLSRMRDETCPVGEFRKLLREISLLMGYELTAILKLSTQKIRTPLQEMDAPVLDGPLPVIVPILRAGLGMSEGLTELIPDAFIGHIGVYRDKVTHRPVEYLIRLPNDEGNTFILTDPILATGYSAVHSIDVLKSRGIPGDRIFMMCLVAAPEGVKIVEQHHPDVRIYTAALDECLNDHDYIVPGLGDAGDRLLGTL